jgi:serine/threonine-protein kinase
MVIDFLADVFRGRNPGQAPSDTLTARELLEWGTERVETEFATRPAVQASLFLVLGNAHHNLGLLDEGVGLLERSVALRRDVFGECSGELAEALLALGGVHRNNRDFSYALIPLREALDIRRAAPEDDEVELAAALEALGMAFRDTQQPDSAEILLREALEIRTRYPHMEAEYAGTTLILAYVLRGLGKLDEAAALYEMGIPGYRSLPDRNDVDLAVHINNLAYLRRVAEEYEEAEKLYRESYDLVSPIYGRGHPTTLLVSSNLAGVLFLQGKTDESLAIFRQRTEDADAQWPEGHWRVGQTYLVFGDAQLRSGFVREAESAVTEAADQFERALGPQHNWTTFAWARIAAIRLITGAEEEGQAFLDRMHAWVAKEREDGGGTLSGDTRGLMEPFLRLLDDVGLDEEHRRFGALLEE